MWRPRNRRDNLGSIAQSHLLSLQPVGEACVADLLAGIASFGVARNGATHM